MVVSGREVALFAGVSALVAALSDLAFLGLPKGRRPLAITAWVLGSVLLGAGATGITYYLASRRRVA